MSLTPRWDLGRYRPLLQLLARRLHLDPRLRRRLDRSDLVQETMLRAHANQASCRAATEAERVKWLHEILERVAIDEVRKARAKKRDVAMEQYIHEVSTQSSARLEKVLADHQPSPSERAERREQILRLAEAIGQLPEDQRDVLILRKLQGAPVAEIAALLGRTEKSVGGLLVRGMQKLAELMGEPREKEHDA